MEASKSGLFGLKLFLFSLVNILSGGVYAAGYPAPVEVAEVEQCWLAPVVWVAGLVTSRNDAQLASEAEGRLTRVAEEGTQVKQGEVIARIDDSLLKIAFSEAETAVSQIQVRLDFLDREVERLRSLARQNNAARTQLDETESDRDGTLSQLAAARARLMTAQERLDRAVLRAPFDGVVVARLKRVGEWVGRGEAVIEMVDPAALEIEAAAPLRLGPFLKVGQSVSVEIDGRTIDAKLRQIVKVARGPSHLLPIKLALAGPGLYAGQPVRLALPAARPRKVLAMPRDAMVLRSGRVMVYRVKADNTAEALVVTTGIAQGDLIEVKGALKAGDRVVTRGGERLRPGQPLRLLGGAAQSWGEQSSAGAMAGPDEKHGGDGGQGQKRQLASASQWPDKKQWSNHNSSGNQAAGEE